MNNQAGVLTFTDLSQVQKSRATRELDVFLGEMYVNRPTEMVDRISATFQNGSFNRSHFFMDFKYRDYASMRMGLSYLMPVFGVKGMTPKISRQANYVEVMFAKEADLSGTRFNDVIFGMDYLTGENTVNLTDNELVSSMGSAGAVPGYRIRADWKELVAHILVKLWEAGEQAPRTRFIIKMKRAEARSMFLLQQLYLLLPAQLRLQLGFETNVGAADLAQIQNETLPIYVMTMEENEVVDPGKYTFPIAVFEEAKETSYSYNEKRLNLILRLAESMTEQMASVLDNAEKTCMQNGNEDSSSFRFYESILESLFTDVSYWWTRERYNSLSELKRDYSQQSRLMENGEYRKEALAALYGTIYPNSSLAEETMRLLEAPQSEERDLMLNFLAKDLLQEKFLAAAAGFGIRLQEAGEKAKAEALAKQKDELKTEYITALRKEQKNVEELKSQIQELTKRNSELKRLQGTMEFGGADKTSAYKKALEREKAKNEALGKQRLIFMFCSGILGIAAAVFLVLFLIKGNGTAEMESPAETSVVTTAVTMEETLPVTAEETVQETPNEISASEPVLSATESVMEETTVEPETAGETNQEEDVDVPEETSGDDVSIVLGD